MSLENSIKNDTAWCGQGPVKDLPNFPSSETAKPGLLRACRAGIIAPGGSVSVTAAYRAANAIGPAHRLKVGYEGGIDAGR